MEQIQFAGALFTRAERDFNNELYLALSTALDIREYDIFLPQEKCRNTDMPSEIFHICKYGIESSKYMIAILDGTDVDSGTAWEIGNAYAQNIPIIGIRTDFRQRGDDFGLNCMISKSLYDLIEESNIDYIVKDIVDILTNQEKKIMKRYSTIQKCSGIFLHFFKKSC